MARKLSAAAAAMAAVRAHATPHAASTASVVHHAPKPAPIKRLTDAEIEAATARGERQRKTQRRAASVQYNRKAKLIVVTFTNGVVFSFPPALVNGFSTASADQLAAVRLSGSGFGIHWDALDTDLTAHGLINYVFGSFRVRGWLSGSVKSSAQTVAARADGAKGGRRESFAAGKPGAKAR